MPSYWKHAEGQISIELPREAVSWTGYDMKKLRKRVEKVNHLRKEEQQHGFTEVAQDADNSKGHACKVAERVSHKHWGRVPATKWGASVEKTEPVMHLVN